MRLTRLAATTSASLALALAPAVGVTLPTDVPQAPDEAEPGLALARAKPRPARSSHLRIATLNTAVDLSVGHAVRDARKLATTTAADVLLLQEVGNPTRRHHIVAQLAHCRRCAYHAFAPRKNVRGANPILYRRQQFRLFTKGSVRVTRDTYVGRRGAGPTTIREKYVNYVGLVDRKTHRRVFVLNTHLIASVQGHRGKPKSSQSRRLRVYRQHMNRLQRLVDRLAKPRTVVVVGGDFNVDFRQDRRTRSRLFPYERFRRTDLRSSYRALGEPNLGTHVLRNGNDRRLIDYVAYTPRPGVTPLQQRVLRGFRSDHRPLVVDLRLRGLRRR